MTAAPDASWPSFDDVRLETARLVLRPFTHADVPALYRMFSDAEVQRYTLHAPWTSVDQATQYVADDRRERAAGQTLRLAMERRGDHVVVGTCDLFAFARPSRRAELGYGLDRAAWGQGYAREAVRAMWEYLSTRRPTLTIVSLIHPDNARSIRVATSFGATRVDRVKSWDRAYDRYAWPAGNKPSMER